MSSNNMYLHDCVNENAFYEIQELDEKNIVSFFEDRGEKDKIEKLKSLKITNKKLFDEIKDILLVNLFYDSMNYVSNGTTIYDLFWLKDHYWNSKRKDKLIALNLPEPQSDEILEINHSARSKNVFAEGAIAAAKYLVNQEPGFYNMDNMLG